MTDAFSQFLQIFIIANVFNIYICNEQNDLLTDEEIRRIFNTDAAPNYGVIEMKIPEKRQKRSVKETWDLPVKFSNGSRLILNLYETSGILANHRTPIWLAEGRYGDVDREDRSVRYTPDPMGMERLGNFTFYQDYAKQAAIVLFSADNTIEGFVEDYRLKRVTPEPLRRTIGHSIKYVLKRSINLNEIPLQEEWSKKLDSDVLRPSGPPSDVFPELLIVLDQHYIQKSVVEGLRRLLAYFNAIDLLFSTMRSPRIKLNIAGIILPMDSRAIPWTARKYRIGRKLLNATSLMKKISDHFLQYQDEFPPDSYDFIITLTSMYLIADDRFLVAGTAFKNVACNDWKHRIATINDLGGTYVTGAHELGHLFSANDDENNRCRGDTGIMGVQRDNGFGHVSWSQCSLRSFAKYFRKEKSKCLDNCPKTMDNCPAPGHICATGINTFCETPWPPKTHESISCKEDVPCRVRKGYTIFTMPDDGFICESEADHPTRICYQNECVPYEPFEDVCPQMRRLYI